ncbi:Uncharacterised protein [Burkholderia pseudomallei]|nr:Uncharacterised protein [Burkholderia pseudomallei]
MSTLQNAAANNPLSGVASNAVGTLTNLANDNPLPGALSNAVSTLQNAAANNPLSHWPAPRAMAREH